MWVSNSVCGDNFWSQNKIYWLWSFLLNRHMLSFFDPLCCSSPVSVLTASLQIELHTHTQTNTNTYTTEPFLPHNIQEWLTNKIISFVFSLSSQIIIYPDKVSLYPACIPPENSNGQNWSAVMFHNKKYSHWWLKCYNNLNHLLNYNRKTIFWFEGNILRFFENCLSVDRWEEFSMGFRDENLGLSPDLLAIHFGVKHSEPQKSSPVKWG